MPGGSTTAASRPRRFGLAASKSPISAKTGPPQTILGAEQRPGFWSGCEASQATWKIWGNTTATLDMRADPQNLPPGITKPWPGAGYAGFGGGDHSTRVCGAGEIYDFVRDHGITGFATVAGDRHSFWAGLAAKGAAAETIRARRCGLCYGSISAPRHGRSAGAQLAQRLIRCGRSTWDKAPSDGRRSRP